MKAKTGLVLLSGFFFLGRASLGQPPAPPPPETPLTALAQKLAAPPRKAVAAKADKRGARFKKSPKRLTFHELAVVFANGDADAQKALLGIMEGGAIAFETEAKKEGAGLEGDLALAMSYFLSSLYSVHTGKGVGEEEINALVLQAYSVFDTKESKGLLDADKQKFWEYCIGMTSVCVGLYESAEDKATKAAYKKLAGELFKTLLPVDTKNITFTKEGIRVGGVKPEAGAGALSGKLSIRYAKPAGWKEEKKNGITVLSSPQERIDFRISLLSLQPRNGRSLHAAFRDLWAQLMTPYKQSKHTPLIATVEGDKGMPIAFDGTQLVAEEGSPEVFLYLVDTGDSYLPIVVFWRKEGISFDLSEDRIGRPVFDFIESLKISGASPKRSTIGRELLIGTWEKTLVGSLASYYSSSGSFLGDASTGGEQSFMFRPDGTYESSFIMVMRGKVGFTSSHKGVWKLEGHRLTITPTSGSNKTVMKPHKFYVMGGGIGADGEKKLLMSYHDEPAELVRALIYSMNYGNHNSSYLYTRGK